MVRQPAIGSYTFSCWVTMRTDIVFYTYRNLFEDGTPLYCFVWRGLILRRQAESMHKREKTATVT